MGKQHIFITGCTNSGTGFLRFLISKHTELSVLMKEGQHYCKALPHDNKFKHVKNRLFSLYPEIYRWSKEEAAGDPKRMKKSFYKHWDTSKDILVEKSAHHMVRLEYTNEIFPNSKFIGIVRSGFAVCEGLKRKKKHPIELCAKHWNRANKIMMEESGNVDFLLVSYEDLCSNPQKVMDTIFSYIGVDKIEINGNWTIPRSNKLGKKKHFKLKDSPNFNNLSINDLTVQDKKIIIEKASEMLEKFGYLEETK